MSVVMSRCSNVTTSISFQQSSVLELLKDCTEYRLILTVLRRVWNDYEGQLVLNIQTRINSFDERLAMELERRDHRIFQWESTLMISLNSSVEFKSLEWRERLLRWIESLSSVRFVVLLSPNASFDHHVCQESGNYL